MAIVITHERFGIYIGHCMGLGFWTRLDCAGQDRAGVFENLGQAQQHVAYWNDNADQGEFEYVEVGCADLHYATIEELKVAGLGHMLGDMEIERLRLMPVMGGA